MRARLLSAGALVMLLVMGVRADTAQSRRDADSLQQKLLLIVVQGQQCPCAQRKKTTVTEAEVNGYLVHHAGDSLPDGVVDPRISILGNGRVAGRATVDLDRVRTSKERGWLDPAAYLTGKLPVTATGILHTQNGKARFELQTATVGALTVPKVVLQELLSYYSRTPDDPDGLNLDDVFDLPAHIREIQVGKAVAYVIQ